MINQVTVSWREWLTSFWLTGRPKDSLSKTITIDCFSIAYLPKTKISTYSILISQNSIQSNKYSNNNNE